MTHFKRGALFLFVLASSVLLINCAGTPATNPVQEAQNEYQQIKDDTLVVFNAPDALQKAAAAVKEAQKSLQGPEDQNSVKELAFIAQQRVQIARKTAELRAAQHQVQRISSELQSLMNTLDQTKQKQINARLAEMTPEERAKHLKYFRTRQTNRGLLLRFLNTNFELEKASLKSSAEPPVDELADFLAQYPQRNVHIEGHTDNTGSKSFNKKLSLQRANTIQRALIARGIDSSRIEAVGLGEQYPIASNKTDLGRRRNRRVDVIVSDKTGVIPDRQ